jgi:hypothetical protein
LEALAGIVLHPVEVEGTDELISAEELSESEAALQDYWSGRDTGITPDALKRKGKKYGYQKAGAWPRLF